MNYKKLVAGAASLALCSTALTGCAAVDLFDSVFHPKPKNAQEMIEKYNEKNFDNYKIGGSFDLTYTLSAYGESVNIPMEFTIEQEMYKDKIHQKIIGEINAFGESADSTVEAYIQKDGDSYVSYTKSDGDWEKETIDEPNALWKSKITIIGENANFEETDDSYVVSGSMSDLMGDDYLNNILGGVESDSDLGLSDTGKVLEDGDVEFVFNKENYQLEKASISNLKYSVSQEVNDVSADGTTEFDLELNFSDYGKISEDDVTFNEDDTPAAETDDSSDEPKETEETKAPETIGKGEDSSKKQSADSSNYGTYQGTDFSSLPIQWSVFENDGWEMDLEDDGKYSFVSAHNKKYPDVSLYLYPKDDDLATIEKIKTDGIYGYSISSYSDSADYPEMSWKGNAFGCSEQDIIDSYGEPSGRNSSSYSDSTSSSLSYEISDDAELDFSFIDGKLTGADLYVW